MNVDDSSGLDSCAERLESTSFRGATLLQRRVPNDTVPHDVTAIVICVATVYSAGVNAHNPSSSHIVACASPFPLNHVLFSYLTLIPIANDGDIF